MATLERVGFVVSDIVGMRVAVDSRNNIVYYITVT